ncbi:MAG: sigma-70 family RNA polymerase sigma factor [Clostridiales Family XIII bacterium]|jgi:RNA polymerase sigma-70 factor (ECF subfamily)|nr:sigma-70 family RNA polymerase sigma factor [Clostridiales Family XIII bacterium]
MMMEEKAITNEHEKEREELYALVEQAINGSQSAFEKLYLSQSKAILYHARSLLINPEDAYDAAQDVVIAMMKNIRTLKDPSAFLSWQYQLIRYVCSKHVRKLKRIHFGQEPYDISDNAELYEDKNIDANTERVIEEQERSKIVLKVIAKLSKRQREAVILYYYEDLSYREIAEVMGSSVSTVSTNLMKAKKNIKAELVSMGIVVTDENVNDAYSLHSVIAIAVARDVDAKCPPYAVTEFQNTLKFPKTLAKTLEKITDFQLAQRNRIKSAIYIKMIACCIVVAVVGGVFVYHFDFKKDTDGTPLDKPNAPVSIQSTAYEPDVDIVLSGGACECGHIDPQSAHACIYDSPDSYVQGWEIVDSSNTVIAKGDGDEVSESLQKLPKGMYLLEFVINGTSSRTAVASKNIEIMNPR